MVYLQCDGAGTFSSTGSMVSGHLLVAIAAIAAISEQLFECAEDVRQWMSELEGQSVDGTPYLLLFSSTQIKIEHRYGCRKLLEFHHGTVLVAHT